MKISATDHDDALALFKRGPSGNTVDDSVKVCQWLVEAGVDAIHVSTGSFFPHPQNPAGVDLPVEDLAKSYDTMISSGERTFLQLPAVSRPLRPDRAAGLERRRRRSATRSRAEPAATRARSSRRSRSR